MIKRPNWNLDVKELEEYIKDIYNLKELSQKVKMQIQRFIKDYKYTPGGIAMTLYYLHAIKKNPIKEEYKQTIGIVPHVYTEAEEYFYYIRVAQMANRHIDFSNYKTKKRVVEIYKPREHKKHLKEFKLGED